MKACKKYQKLIVLYAADELNDRETKTLEAHLERCPSCVEAMRAHVELLTRIGEQVHVESASDLLNECRCELRERLRQEKRAQMGLTLWERVAESLQMSLKPANVLVSAALLLVTGIIVGRYLVPSYEAVFYRYAARSESVQALLAFESGIAPEIHSIEFDPATKQVQIHMSAEKTYRISGDVDDRRIREMLTYALREVENPGVRMRSVKAFAARPYSDDEMESALIYALENDSNMGVRLQALKVLRELPLNKQIKDALVKVLLRDTNAGMRKEAVDALSSIGDEEIMTVFMNAAKSDTSEYVRFKATKVLERREETVQR